MHAALPHLRRLYETPNGKKILRYTIVSGVTTAVGFSVLWIVFGVLHLWTEVPSAIFANVVAIAPSYYLNRNWVWGKTGRSRVRQEVLPFGVLSVAGIVLSVASAAIARHVSVANHLSHGSATALLLGVVLIAFGSLWVIKLLIFDRLFKMATSAPSEASDCDG